MENTFPDDQELENQDASNASVTTEQTLDATTGATPGDTSDLLKKLQDELAEAKDKYLRLYAEFDNHRRRTAKEKYELRQTANEELINTLLPVLDDFERGEKSFTDKNSKEAEGFFLIQNKFKKILEQSGVTPMKLSIGSDFNPDLQEAITQIPAPTEKLKGKVIDVVEKGYLLNDKVIRFAKVVIGQ
jgi:molecular chaperone GrpE